ncbi:MAG: WD40 repeat domain-containing protein [Armatimonadetes bacterium]|nr:WD40 repeat domain-containing protein [Armatimonadota bacterium]
MIAALVCSATLVATPAPAYSVNQVGKMIGQEALCFAFAPSGYRFAAGMADNSVKVFDAKTRKTLKTLKGHKFPARAVAWSPKGRRIASGAENAEIRVWDVKSGNSFSLTGHQRGIQWLAFNRSGTRLLSTSDDDTLRVWDLNKRKTVLTIKGNGINLYGARYNRAGTRIIVGTLGKGMCLYSASNGKLLKSFGEHGGVGVNDVDINSSYTRAVTAGRDGKVGVWDLKKSKRISYLQGHKDWVMRVSLSPNGRLLASSAADGTVRVWDMNGLKPVATLQNQSYMGSPVAWSASSGYLVTIGSDYFVRIYTVTK